MSDTLRMAELRGKRLLILGCGYLGGLLVSQALKKGMSVLAVSRNVDTLERVGSLGAETFCGYVNEMDWHAVAGEDVDFVVNCVSSAGGGLDGYRKSYIGGNDSLCRWSKYVGFKGRAVYTSSVSAYGDAGGEWVDEATASSPTNERGQIVVESENIFTEKISASSHVVLRLAGLYGPDRHLMLDRIKDGQDELPGWGDYYLNLVRIEDVASAIWRFLEMESAPSGVFGVVDDAPSLKQEMVEWIAEAVGMAVPKFSGTSGQSGRSSRRLGETGRPANRRISNAAFKQACAWQPSYPDFRAGFADLIARA